MANQNDRSNTTHHARPEDAATDPRAAARQDQVKRDHDVLQDSARRVESSVSSDVRETPVGQNNQNDRSNATPHARPEDAATDPRAAARQDQVKRDHDELQDSARRVESSVPSDVRDTPIRQENQAGGANADAGDARRNADALRDSARNNNKR